MESIWIAIALVVAGAAFAWAKMSSSRAAANHAAPAAPVPKAGAEVDLRATQAIGPWAHPVVQPDVPEVDIPLELVRPVSTPYFLASYQPVTANEVTGDRKQQFVKSFHNVPRPPKLLHNLLSSDFVSSASSAELEDLIVGEPLIAAKVLATVNSPLFGLKTQVRSIGQAVNYLGLNAVRSVCLQYILIASFKADSKERECVLDATWRTSALASELIQQLAQKLSLPDQGALVSAVVLSFLGRLATAATVPLPVLTAIPADSLLDRASAEQQALGLSASEIGRLLMLDWELPRKIVEDAADIDSVLTTKFDAATTLDPVRRGRLALCYLCARLGERLAQGELTDLRSYDLLGERSPDFFHLWSYFDDARMIRLAELLRSPELDASLRKMLTTMREPELVV